MPLVEPVPLDPADRVGGVHFVAIGGAGMSGIAAAYAQMGVAVSGSDRDDSAIVRDLAAQGIRTHVGHDAGQVGDAQTIVISSAIREDNVEVAEARRRGLRVWHRSAALGALMLNRRGVAVSGTHGKTTTSGMVAAMLIAVGADPGYVIGSPLATTGTSSSLGSGETFVVEADESDGSFLQYPAEIVVVTNVETDHLDNWGTPEAYRDGFVRLVSGPDVRTVVLSADDPQTSDLARAARTAGATVVTVGESDSADVLLSDVLLTPDLTQARLTASGDEGLLSLAVPGRFNLHNAAAAYAVGRALGYPGDALRRALGEFRGTHRRFELKGQRSGVRVYDDYAHHPTEVAALLEAARDRVVPGGRLVIAFQPHLFSRTVAFAQEFVDALAAADEVVVCGIYPARESAADFPEVSGRMLQEGLRARGVPALYADTLDETALALVGLLRRDDLLLTVGAGDVTTLGPLVLDGLGEAP